MSAVFRKLLRIPDKIVSGYFKSSNARKITTGKLTFDSSKNYEGDGKTTVTILNRMNKYLIMIDSVSSMGFRLNNGIFVIGPVAAFPRTVLQWNVNNIYDMEADALSLFYLLEPKLDILVLGTGDVRLQPTRKALEILKAKKLTVEILPTEQACSTFNFLNAEGRAVAGAFIPPSKVQVHADEVEILEKIDAIDDYKQKPIPLK